MTENWNKYLESDAFNLRRFIKAQEADSRYSQALKEVCNGCKQNHWIWYIFPQIKGLGVSMLSEYYGITCLEEARAYLENEILSARLREITETLYNLEGKSAVEIFGGVDALKVKSCVTLFDMISPHDIFEKVLDKYYNGERCERTKSI